MLKSSKLILHNGKVVEAHDDTVKVMIQSASACSSCHSKDACPVSETEQKVIEIKNTTESFSPGDDVIVYFEQAIGFHALFLGYLFPFIILFSVLLISFSLTGKELVSGILALFVLLPYYLGLYLFRDKIKKSFLFKIVKKDI
ncbi:MAG: SoxR reducing system RseC family protein [Candidatus Omnitrophica bacterium]|nr:SoxR reducing system RseC family protein [Candidatus Omnitrophota bacterium]